MEQDINLQEIKNNINELLVYQSKIILGIDGNCGAGKTSLANSLSQIYKCDVIRMDDFFLQPHQRTIQRQEEPGGNIDYERFIEEVVINIKNDTNIIYKAFNCKIQALQETKAINFDNILIIEGTYSFHDLFDDIYDLKIFLEIDYKAQLRRIENRNGAIALEMFKNKWIPLENKYFKEMHIRNKSDLLYKIN